MPEASEAARSSPTVTPSSSLDPPPSSQIPPADSQPGARASILGYRTVDEIWDPTTFKYTRVESAPTPEVDEFDKHIFVVRRQGGKKIGKAIYYIDVNSEGLRDILRSVLQHVKGTSLKEDKPTVEQNLLYHFIPALDAYSNAPTSRTLHDPLDLQHLDLLVTYIKTTYASTKQRFDSLECSGEITYDMLWALFEPNDLVYGKCLGTGKSRCIKFDFGEERTSHEGEEFFRIEGRYVDHNGKEFGEAVTAVPIWKFQGSKPIHSLEYFPFKYHPNAENKKRKLTKRGWKFAFLKGKHHQQYKGNAFYMNNGQPVKMFVDGRIMIDAALFQEYNPNYSKPSIDELQRRQFSSGIWIQFDDPPEEKLDKVKSNGMKDLPNEHFLICSPTVQGFSLSKKCWLEFAVDNISNICWDPQSFERLAIPEKRKKLVKALAASHSTSATHTQFDDFVAGKGQGLIMLLHGPAGVGKTLTAEGLSETLQKPLYTLSSGELGTNPKDVEDELSRIFRLAAHWEAMLLLDEADVFMRKRSLDHASNSLITIFLRMLEYYKGIMFLTTNRVNEFDDAIRSRIHIAISYNTLTTETRTELWESFLKKAVTTEGEARYSPNELKRLAERELNGRQIKNAVKTAVALAIEDRAPVSYSHLEVVLEFIEEFDKEMKGPGQDMA